MELFMVAYLKVKDIKTSDILGVSIPVLGSQSLVTAAAKCFCSLKLSISLIQTKHFTTELTH